MEKAPLSRGEVLKALCIVSRRLYENRQGGLKEGRWEVRKIGR